eukprot:TRINITY_DN20216_c1_g1_i1.p1 TRINITY_DN20216_c1_g1~~TRINITY_DN20216_c1_g1_i1.p1  ORF type:complete len:597 (-),score=93.45 TRINITY_DN20216_c1_g1_i1:72-1862(-)
MLRNASDAFLFEDKLGNPSRRVCVFDVHVNAAAAKHPLELPSSEISFRNGTVWKDFHQMMTPSKHWMAAARSWWILNASRGHSRTTNPGLVQASKYAPCRRLLKRPKLLASGLAVKRTSMLVSMVKGVFVDASGKLLALPTEKGQVPMLYHDFLARIQVENSHLDDISWHGNLSDWQKGGFKPSSVSERRSSATTTGRWSAVLALAERLRPDLGDCKVQFCGQVPGLLQVDVLLRPTLHFLDRHFRNFYHFLTLGLTRLIAALPLLRSTPHHILLHSDHSVGSSASYRHIRDAISLLNLDASSIIEYPPCRLLFLRKAITATPQIQVEDERCSEDAATRFGGAPQRVFLSSVIRKEELSMRLTVLDTLSPEAATIIRQEFLPQQQEPPDGRLKILLLDRLHEKRKLGNAQEMLHLTKAAASAAPAASPETGSSTASAAHSGRHTVKLFRCEEWSIGDQIREFRSSQLVIGVEGACLANALWMNPGSGIIEIGLGESPPHDVLPKDHCGTTYATLIASAAGIHYFSLLVLEQSFEAKLIHPPLNEFEQIVKLALAKLGENTGIGHDAHLNLKKLDYFEKRSAWIRSAVDEWKRLKLK